MSQSASEKFDSYWKKRKMQKVQTKGDKRSIDVDDVDISVWSKWSDGLKRRENLFVVRLKISFWVEWNLSGKQAMENFFFRNILRIIAFVYILEKWGKRQKVCGKTGSIFNPENYTPCSSQTNQEFLKVPCFHSRQDYELFCSSSLKYNTWIGQGKGKSQNGKVSKLSRLEARFSKASETFRANIKKPPLVHLYLKTPETSCMKQMKGTSFILRMCE